MKLQFLNPQEAFDLFKEPDEYARKMPLSNLQMCSPNNPTLEGYQEIFLNSFDEWTEEEKKRIESHCEILWWLDFSVKLIKTKGSHALDITQTRKDCILVRGGYLNCATFVHEVYHILSRTYPDLTEELSKIWNFRKTQDHHIDHPHFLLNPDALNCDYLVDVKVGEDDLIVVPFLIRGLNTGLKVYGTNDYIESHLTNYDSLVQETTYTGHPEEICAEYFALCFNGSNIFSKQSESKTQKTEYQEKILRLLGQKGLVNFSSSQ